MGPFIQILVDLFMELAAGWLEDCNDDVTASNIEELYEKHPRLVRLLENRAMRHRGVRGWRNRENVRKEMKQETAARLADPMQCEEFCAGLCCNDDEDE